ncbi:unnamed protein product [Gulo gulo]|uniref:Uncharacterized protein n=1 Tax=Gulo gulo TaxID=48420 RepID=A0A9X9Q2M8_GULGU|nr:unnamed protein product [Gulo gulo]
MGMCCSPSWLSSGPCPHWVLTMLNLAVRILGDSSTTWLTPRRRAPCLQSWWRSSGSCGRMVGCKPASTELQSTNSMIQHLTT